MLLVGFLDNLSTPSSVVQIAGAFVRPGHPTASARPRSRH